MKMLPSNQQMSEEVNKLKQLNTLLKMYGWILDSYIIDFFTSNHFEELPSSWKQCLQSSKVEELGELLDLSSQSYLQKVWPLSLLTIRKMLIHLCTSRQPSNEFQCENIPITNHDNSKELKLRNLFFKRVKPKKRNELVRIARVISNSAEKCGIKKIIDVGCGLGHLSRLLSYGFNLEVVAIESQQALSDEARKLDMQFEVTFAKILQKEESEIRLSSPRHVVGKVGSETTCQDLQGMFDVNGSNHIQFGIVGLHPCGDLAPCLLRLFSSSASIRFINLVGCCYHKMNTNSLSFPMSPENPISELSQESRDLASHTIEIYCKRLKSGDYDYLKVHCYRAALEHIIANKWPKFRRCSLSNVSHTPQLSFYEYCIKALKKLGLHIETHDCENPITLTNLSKWQDIVKFYSLRLLLAPFVENIILWDRLLYLQKQGFPCELITVFNPEVSPRNHLLRAWQ